MEILKIKKLHPDAHVPTRAHDTDAGMDLYALPIEYTDEEKEGWKCAIKDSMHSIDQGKINEVAKRHEVEAESVNINSVLNHISDADWDEYFFNKKITIQPHTTVMIPTGIAIAVPTGYMGCIYARSGLASKKSLAPINCVGIIDSGFRGEVKVALHNHGDDLEILDVGDRIAQLVIQPISLCTPVEVEELDETDRGVGGFGSSGAK